MARAPPVTATGFEHTRPPLPTCQRRVGTFVPRFTPPCSAFGNRVLRSPESRHSGSGILAPGHSRFIGSVQPYSHDTPLSTSKGCSFPRRDGTGACLRSATAGAVAWRFRVRGIAGVPDQRWRMPGNESIQAKYARPGRPGTQPPSSDQSGHSDCDAGEIAPDPLVFGDQKDAHRSGQGNEFTVASGAVGPGDELHDRDRIDLALEGG